MTCPSCGSPGAYVGLAKVECDRKGCEKYVAPTIEALASSTTAEPAFAWYDRKLDDLLAAMLLPADLLRGDGTSSYQHAIHARWWKPFASPIVYRPAVDADDDQPNPGATDPGGSSSTTGPS